MMKPELVLFAIICHVASPCAAENADALRWFPGPDSVEERMSSLESSVKRNEQYFTVQVVTAYVAQAHTPEGATTAVMASSISAQEADKPIVAVLIHDVTTMGKGRTGNYISPVQGTLLERMPATVSRLVVSVQIRWLSSGGVERPFEVLKNENPSIAAAISARATQNISALRDVTDALLAPPFIKDIIRGLDFRAFFRILSREDAKSTDQSGREVLRSGYVVIIKDREGDSAPDDSILELPTGNLRIGHDGRLLYKDLKTGIWNLVLRNSYVVLRVGTKDSLGATERGSAWGKKFDEALATAELATRYSDQHQYDMTVYIFRDAVTLLGLDNRYLDRERHRIWDEEWNKIQAKIRESPRLAPMRLGKVLGLTDYSDTVIPSEVKMAQARIQLSTIAGDGAPLSNLTVCFRQTSNQSSPSAVQTDSAGKAEVYLFPGHYDIFSVLDSGPSLSGAAAEHDVVLNPPPGTDTSVVLEMSSQASATFQKVIQHIPVEELQTLESICRGKGKGG